MTLTRVAPAPPSSSTRSSHAPRVNAVELGVIARRAVWALLVVLQLFNAALLACLAAFYFSRNTRGSPLWTAALFFLFADAYAFIDRSYVVVAVTYTLLSAAFAASGLRIVWLSLRGRRFKFGASQRSQRIALTRSKSQLFTAVLAPFQSHASTNASRWRRITDWIDTVSFMLGVHGPLFDLRFAVDRGVGVATQTVAAYSSSHSISNLYLNQTYGLVLFLSCVSTPIFHRVFRANRTKQRLAYLLSDLVLDFVWGSIIPIWMHLPIVYMYYTALTEAVGDSTTSAREIRRVLVLSWGSLMLSVIPFITSLVSILEIQAELVESSSQAPMKTSQPSSPRARDTTPKHRVHVNTAPSVATKKHLSARLFHLTHGAIAMYGCSILVISLLASDVFGLVTEQPQFACVFPLNPWFSTKEACIKRFVNCSEAGFNGSRTEIEAALELFDDGSLADLHLQSCAALEIPDAIHRFPHLTSIMIEDSWIKEWPLSAAVTIEHFTSLKSIKFLGVDTNATLHGLVSAPIAATVEYIRFYDVPNAEKILSAVGSNWQHLQYFDCDACNLSDVPLAIDTMSQLLTLSLAGSRIAELRDDWITRWDLKLIGLWMDENEELTDLSDTVWRQAATCSVFSMQFTNLSVIPEWVPDLVRSGFVVYGHGSPLCDEAGNILGGLSIKLRKVVSCEYNDE